MAFDSALAGTAFLAGRALFAVVVGYMALGNLLDPGQSIAYAKSKGVPLAGIAVPSGSLALVAGAVAVLLGVYPTVGAAAVVAVLAGLTPMMHDFWAFEGQDAQNEQFHFLKNAGLVGAGLLLFALAGVEWPYAVGVGL